MRRFIGASESSSIYILSICVGNILSLFLQLILSKSGASLDGMSVYSWIGYALMQAAFLATVFAYCRIRRIDAAYSIGLTKPMSPAQFAVLPFIAIAAILVFLPLANLWGAFMGVIGFSGSGAPMPAYSNVGIYFLSLLLMAVLPAFGEEFLMRGVVFRGLSTRGVWFGVFMSGLLFSLMHANPLQTVHQFGLGVTLALTVVLTGSVFCAVVVHFINNFISITMAAYMPEVDELYAKLGYYNYLTGAVSVIVGLLLFIILFYILYRLGEKDRAPSGGIEYEGFSIYVPAEVKTSPIRDFFAFFKSLFTRSGWARITRVLSRKNGVERVERQPMIGVWIAIAFAVIYWLFSFIAGLL